jgi:hypothetical protein
MSLPRMSAFRCASKSSGFTTRYDLFNNNEVNNKSANDLIPEILFWFHSDEPAEQKARHKHGTAFTNSQSGIRLVKFSEPS